MKTSHLYITATTILIISIIVTLPYQNTSSTKELGVKTGLWAKYKVETYSELFNRDNDKNDTRKGVYIIEFEVISISGSNVTLRESMKKEDGTPMLSSLITGDPLYPIYSKYADGGFLEHDINIFIIPPNLSPGSLIPDPIWITDLDDTTQDYSWVQRVNSTVEWGDGGLTRLANHLEWRVESKGMKNDGTFTTFQERSGHYDVRTGVLLSWHNVSRKIYYDWASKPIHVFYYIHDYVLIDSSFYRPG
jgi:hypothetical protein